MQNDFLVTIFSRNKGKISTFSLGRRLVYIMLIMLLFLVASSILFGQAYFQERRERRRLEIRIATLERSASRLEEHTGRPGAEIPAGVEVDAPSEVKVEVSPVVKAEVLPAVKEELEVRRPAMSAQVEREEEEAVAGASESSTPPSDEITNQTQSVEPAAKIDDPRVTSLEGDREGFRLDFKLVNLIGEPITGNVAIIASLKPPHNPQFVSFPSMKLVDGMPVKLRKTVAFDIRYFKNVTGRFYFPFSYSQAFRILVYSRDEELILDSTVPVEEVALQGLLSGTYESSINSSSITQDIN